MHASQTVESHASHEGQLISSALYNWTNRDMKFSGGVGRCRGSPALTVHNGQLWCLWVNKDDQHLYYATCDNQSWGPGTPFARDYWTGSAPDSPNVGPALADFNGVLHAAYSYGGDLVHYQYDDTAKRWGRRCLFARSSATPSLCAFDGKLFCAFQGDGNRLMWTTWEPVGGWVRPVPTDEKTWGSPALYTLNGLLCLLFSENDGNRKTQNTAFDTSTKSWTRKLISAPNQQTAYGVSATSFNQGTALMAFQSNDGKGLVLVDTYSNSSWQHEESVGGAKSNDTPAIAILNGIINVVYDARNNNSDLLWSQATLTNYTPDSWMTALASTRPNLRITDMSIPGTHDTCAISVVPWVATQDMTVLAQLNAGIRYFDLRCRLEDGFLMMYHGPYSLDMYFEDVMKDIYSWLRSHPKEGIIVQLKDENPVDPTSFATAVTALIRDKSEYWNTAASLPMLADIQGKIQLIRRYKADLTNQQLGIDATAWSEHDNSPRFTIPVQAGGDLVIQDQWQLSGAPKDIVPQKFEVVTKLMDQARVDQSHSNLYINYTSVTSAWPVSGAGPVAPLQLAVGYWNIRDEYTPGVNVHLRNKIVTGPLQAHYGVIVMDYPELPQDDMINYIIGSNF